MKQLYILGLLLFCITNIFAQNVSDSVFVHFKQSSPYIDTLYMKNGESLSTFFQQNLRRFNDSLYVLKGVQVIGSSSPEASLNYNEKLAMQRAQSLSDYIKDRLPIEERLLEVASEGANWKELTDMVVETMEVPYRNQVLEVLQKGYRHNECLWRLKQIAGGKAYRWLSQHMFPSLRRSRVIVSYEKKEIQQPVLIEELPKEEPVVVAPVDTVVKEVVSVPEKKSVYWVLKTNALYDLALVPNIGVEIYAGKQWSVAANWMYAWWNSSNRYWRIYGGDVEARRWFGKKAEEKPLQGHHVGAYAQLFTYDMTFNGRGYLGDKWSYAVGLSYGYSLPIASQFNLDFNIGLGYMGGKYKEYKRIEGHSVWQVTKNRNWFGPTKAEVSLVWLLGDVLNKKQKGGRR